MAALMLRHLEVESVRLMTNNPLKVEELRALGVVVLDRIPLVITPTAHSAGYLEAKRVRMRHQLPSRPSTNSVVELPTLPSRTGSDAE